MGRARMDEGEPMKTKVIAVPTQEISKIVQEKLFELGYEWPDDKKKITVYPNRCYGISACFFIYPKEAYLMCGSRPKNWDDEQEITLYDLWQMKPLEEEKSDIWIPLQGFKVNLSKARELGLVEEEIGT